MKFTDTHAHIYSNKYESDRQEVIQRSREQGIHRIFMPNVDIGTIEPMLAVERKNPEMCLPMMGLHPCDVKEDFKEQLNIMEEWISRRQFAGIGETGLDLYWDKTFFEQQKDSLRIQIQWAKERRWPIILHCRESMDETIRVIQEEHDQNLFGIFHCFTGTVEQARAIIDLGFYLGIGGVSTYKNGGLDNVLPEIGIERIVLETDGPYLAPIPHRGKRNSPEYIPLIAQRVANILHTTIEDVSMVTEENVDTVFKHYLK